MGVTPGLMARRIGSEDRARLEQLAPEGPDGEETLFADSPMIAPRLLKGAGRLSKDATVYMTAPDKNGTPSLPKRNGPKGLLPSTWLKRTLRVQYVDGFGAAVEKSGILLDFYPAGPVLNVGGAKTLLAWERLVLCELVED
jgi:hypothetical protein